VTGGENVYPAEVEAALERYPAVAAACVFGVPDDEWGEVVAAALVRAPGERLDDVHFQEFVRANLASHRRPRLLAEVDAFAVTGAGKLDRRETARLAAAALKPEGARRERSRTGR
jgi:O-succinylbenzoic acid--CoA ligase